MKVSVMVGGRESAARGVALVAAGRDALVLPFGEPRVARNVPRVCEPSLEAGLAAKDLIDGARAAKDIALIVDGVQLFEQVVYLKRGELRARCGS